MDDCGIDEDDPRAERVYGSRGGEVGLGQKQPIGDSRLLHRLPVRVEGIRAVHAIHPHGLASDMLRAGP